MAFESGGGTGGITPAKKIDAPAALIPFIKWGIAWFVLLFILVAAYNAGWDTAAMGFAGFLALGALYMMGPDTIKKVQRLWQ